MSLDTVKSESYPDFVNRILKPGTKTEHLTHAALGIGGESGEIVDIIKKHVIYGKHLDEDKLLEEIGDELYYIQVALNQMGKTLDDACRGNMTKLNKRFGSGSYSAEQAMKRADDIRV